MSRCLTIRVSSLKCDRIPSNQDCRKSRFQERSVLKQSLEAYELQNNNRRSALVLLVAAAEVGLKEYVANVGQDAAWLINNVPSPPLRKMLKEYLPMLPTIAGTKAARPPKKIRRLLDQSNNKRNDIVHKGEADISHSDLADYLDAVNDFLYLLDVYTGHEWARDLISSDTLAAMDEEAKGKDA